MRNDRDWRAVDRQRRTDDWRSAGEVLMWPFEVIGGALAICAVFAFLSMVFLGALLLRLAPLIVAVFAAIIIARVAGVL